MSEMIQDGVSDAKRSPYQFGTWYPIESAPKDIDLILYSPDRGCASNRERFELRYWGSVSGRWTHSWATHWMPLPPPPSQGDLSAEPESTASNMNQTNPEGS